MNTQKKHQKKVERQREVRKKVLRRRARIRAEAKEEALKLREERESQRVVNKYTTTVNYSVNGRMTEEEVKQRLQRNMEILKALEDEYDELQKTREANQEKNAELATAFSGLKQDQPQGNWGGEAEVVFKPNLPEEQKEPEKLPAEEPAPEPEKTNV
jgi:hypothetical protein